MKKKKTPLTILGMKFYVICIVLSILFILLHSIDIIFDGIGFTVIKIGKTIIEIFAFGMPPAVLLALFTDVANTKRQRNNYENYLSLKKLILKEKCEYLKVIILECIDELEVEKDWQIKSFYEWFEYFISLENFQSRVPYLMYNISEIKCLAEKYETALAEYHDFVDSKEQQEEKEKIYHLIYDSDAFESTLLSIHNNINNQKNSLSVCSKIFQGRVLDLFPELKDKYNTPYNWDTFLE